MQKITDVALQCKRCRLIFKVSEGHACDCGEIICPECHGLSEEVYPVPRPPKEPEVGGQYSLQHTQPKIALLDEMDRNFGGSIVTVGDKQIKFCHITAQLRAGA